ncbi:MAG: molybdate ABC transporter substrate-binding protein [Planctomycetales bacterium]
MPLVLRSTSLSLRFPILLGILCLLATAGCDSAKTEKKPAAGEAKPENSSKTVAIAPPQGPAKKVLTVAAASDLKFALPELQSEFQLTYPDYELRLTFAASGTLYSQIKEKAPYDIFLSADRDLPKKLIDEKLTHSKEEFVYAKGTLVLWFPKDATLYVEKDGLGILTHDSIARIAIANPKFAPYGRAAEAALKSAKVYEKIDKKLLMAENISQAGVFIEKGGAEAGLLAQTLIVSTSLKDKGKTWKVPQELYPPIVQAGVILSHCEDTTAAEHFRTLILSDKGREILAKNGLTPPEK